jgi:hypothetical protein
VKDSVRRRLNFDSQLSQLSPVASSVSVKAAIIMSDANTQTGIDDQEDQGKQCTICLSDKDCTTTHSSKNTTVTECGHTFCTTCLLKHLTIRNTCPNCRAEIEPARTPTLEPLTATIVSSIIQEEETSIDVARRIAVIGAFPASEARTGMILSLIREVAFGTGHSLAAWQGTDETTYHSSWNEFEYTQQPDDEDDDDDEDEDGDDDDDNDDDNSESGESGVGSNDNHNNHNNDSIDESNEDAGMCAAGGAGGGNGFQASRQIPVRPVFQSPALARTPQQLEARVNEYHEPIAAVSVSFSPTRAAYPHSNWGWEIVMRLAIFAFALYMKM